MYQDIPEGQPSEVTHPCLTRWRARIDAAERRGRFNADDEQYAKSWRSCAVNEAHEHVGFERHRVSFAPRDESLFSLGLDFCCFVTTNAFKRARKTLDAIERRLGELARGR